ncbi:hypothetical protein BGZ47_004360 [Haplosporangium gracile]|nr:hypothetical protein BGZ47_004360 [Haplosporangium gracile]
MQHLLAYEVTFRNNSSLMSLHLSAAAVPASKQDLLAHYVPASALIPSLSSTISPLQGPSKLKVSSRTIKELPQFYPLLSGYQLEDATGAIIPKFLKNKLTGNTNNISNITFKYEHTHTTVEVITVLLLHQELMKIVVTYYRGHHADIEREEIDPVSDHFRASGHHLQLLPRSCPKL